MKIENIKPNTDEVKSEAMLRTAVQPLADMHSLRRPSIYRAKGREHWRDDRKIAT